MSETISQHEGEITKPMAPSIEEILGQTHDLVSNLSAMYPDHANWGEWEGDIKAYLEALAGKKQKYANLAPKENANE